MRTDETTELNLARRAGFSMIELSLAIMVVSIGVLVVFAMFPSGMKASGLAQEDTVSALFARDVFSSMRGEVNQMSAAEWNNLSAQRVDLASKDWAGSVEALYLDGSEQTIVYTIDLSESSIPVKNHAIRYRATVDDFGGSNVYQGVSLLVWGREYGGLRHSYYTEIVRMNMQ